MDDCEEGQQTTLLQSPTSPQSTSTRKRSTVLFGVVVTLAVVAVLAAVCALVAFYASGGGSGQASEPQSQKAPRQSVTGEDIETGLRRMTRRSVPSPSRVGPTTRPVSTTTSDGSCISQETESNTPAAHIKARGMRKGEWMESTADSESVVAGYQQRWQCNDVYVSRHQVQEQAFVDGGVWFNQTDKSIYVPTCGYYMIYSQVLFVMHGRSLTDSVTVFHNLKIKHNCTWESDEGPIQLQAKASIAPYDDENHDGGIATTYTADVVHLCGGGSVWIEIPDGANGVPCCPRGEDSGTFLGLVLLANTPCSSWPPTITMTHEY